mgnify:FL=1|jgi:hypothetical protein
MIKTKLRTIYVYTTNTYGQKGWTKVGQTSRDANQRISEQDGTSMPEPLIRVKNSNGNVLEFKTYLTDDEIRSELFKLGYHEVRQDKRREWVGGFENPFDNGDEIELAINKIIAKSEIDTRKKYEPYFYKKFIKNVFLRILDINLTLGKKIMEFALELAPRFGKTTWMIDLLITLFEKYGFKLAVLPSYWLSSLSSFEKELYSWKGFDEKIHFVKRGESVKDAIKTWYGKKLIVVELSLHQTDEDKFESSIKEIKKLKSSERLTLIDEADYGVPQPNQMKKIEALQCSVNVYLSGSGLDKITAPLKNIGNNIIRWSYTDMVLCREGNHPLFFKNN